MKINIKKSYDSVECDFLNVILKTFDFPNVLIEQIMECVTIAKFSIFINSELEGFFANSRWLRQGDSLSPYLFVMVMEDFSGLIGRMSQSISYGYH